MPNQYTITKKSHLPSAMPKRLNNPKHALLRNDLHTIMNLTNIVVYIWLKNGNGFWYYISYTQKNWLIGYIWNQKKWVSKTIDFNNIFSYY